MKYDYLIVGAGLTGSVCAYELSQKGYDVAVIEQRNHIGGNCYTKKMLRNIDVHIYGPHIFFTNNPSTWEYINQFDKFIPFKNIVKAEYEEKEYTLPFNLTTLKEIYGNEETPKTDKEDYDNIEDYSINKLGEKLYEILIKGYTEKQWGMKCNQLPLEIIKRIPIRNSYDDNYYDTTYQGIPLNGYTYIFQKMLKNVDLYLNTEYKKDIGIQYENLIHTGSIDKYYDYKYGELPYRSINFAHTIQNGTRQDYAVKNYTSIKIPYTRTIEHKHFLNINNPQTIISYEFPSIHTKDNEPYYPINTKSNNHLYSKYQKLNKEKNIFFMGRLGKYKYLNMCDAIEEALIFCNEIE